jgi:hypothetical protein
VFFNQKTSVTVVVLHGTFVGLTRGRQLIVVEFNGILLLVLDRIFDFELCPHSLPLGHGIRLGIVIDS